MKSVIRSVLGVALVLAWWTLRDNVVSTGETADRIPALVWEGGAGKLTIETDASSAAQMRVSFSEEGDDGRSLETWEDISPGRHSWTIDVPRGVGGYVELGAVEPRPGDRLSWKVSLNGSLLDQQSETLEAALEPGYAFFLQTYFDDYATGQLGDD
jgi:hypothetical protein